MSHQVILPDNGNHHQQQSNQINNINPIQDTQKPQVTTHHSEQQMQQQISSKLSPRLMQQAHQQTNLSQTPISNDQAIQIRQGVGGGFGGVRYNPNTIQSKGSTDFVNQNQSVAKNVGNAIVGGTTSAPQSEPPPGQTHGPTVGDLIQIHGHHSTSLKVQGRKSAGQSSIWNNQNQKYIAKNDSISMKVGRGGNETQEGINEFKQKSTPNKALIQQVANQKFPKQPVIGAPTAPHNWSSQSMNQGLFYPYNRQVSDQQQSAIEQMGGVQGAHNQQANKFQSMQLDHKNQMSRAGMNMNPQFLSNRQNGLPTEESSNVVPQSQLFRPSNGSNYIGVAQGGTGRSVLDTYSKEQSRDSHSLHAKDAHRGRMPEYQNAEANLDYQQIKQNGGIFSPVHHGNMLQKIRMDSKKQSISKDDPTSVQLRQFQNKNEGNASSTVVDQVNKQANHGNNQSLSLQGDSRRNIQKVNGLREVMKVSEQDKLSKTPNYNTYSLNNHKQQQRRKLLFEYGLEKKLQNQAQQQSETQLTMEDSELRQGRLTEEQRMQQARQVYNNYSQEAMSKNNGYLKLYELLDKLKTINIDYLEANELEQLRFFSAQYQYYLSQYQEQQVQQKLSKQANGNPESQNARSSNLSQYGQQMDDVNQKASIQQMLMGGSPLKNEKKDLQNDIYMSQEKFVQNEKNLSQQRLQKSKCREKEISEKGSGAKTTDSLMGIPVISLSQGPAGEKSPNQNTPVKHGQDDTEQFLRMSFDKDMFGMNELKQDDQHFTICEQNIKEIDVANPNQKMVLSSNGNASNHSKKSLQIQNEHANTDGILQYGNNNILSHGSSASRKSLKRNSSNNQFQKVGANTLNTKRNQNLIYQQTGEDKDQMQAVGQNPLGASSADVQQSNRGYNGDLTTTQASSSNNVGGQPMQSIFNQNPNQMNQMQLNAQQFAMATAQQQQSFIDASGRICQQLGLGGFNPQLSQVPFAPPQITINDIKAMTTAQKINIFRHLQRKEKSKFINIQQQKMAKMGIDIDDHRKTSRNKNSLDQNQQGRFGKQANGKFLDIVKRQAYNTAGGQGGHSRSANHASHQPHSQQLQEQAKRQWTQDMKAFGIFQQNELWQFGQMSEAQQKQILICNLQQGKFQGILDEQYAIMQQQALQLKQNINMQQQLQMQQRNFLISSTKDGLESHSNSEVNSQAIAKRQANYGSALGDKEHIQQVDNKFDQRQGEFREGSPGGSMKIPGVDNNGKLDESDLQMMIGQDAKTSLSSIDKTINMQVRNINDQNMQIVIQNQNPQKSIGSPISAFQNKDPNNPSDGKNDNHQDLYFRQSNNDPQDPFNTSMKPKGQQNPIQGRYEESKSQFETYLINILEKYQDKTMGGDNRRMQPRMGIENLLPNFPRHLTSDQKGLSQYYQQQQQMGIQHTYQGTQVNAQNRDKNKNIQNGVNTQPKYDRNGKLIPNGPQTAQNRNNKLRLEKEKSGNANEKIAPDSTKNKKKDDDKEGEESNKNDDDENKGDTEEVKEEPKKPRYFPPRRIPNPFEKAAQEQEQFLQARKDALAKYSNISKNRFKQDESQPLKYVIRPGNNSKLIQRVFEVSGRIEARDDDNGFPGWESADDHFDSLYNFKWKPTSGGIKYDLIGKHGLKQLVNHVKGHGQLTTKDNLFINLKSYYESQKQNVYDVVPLTIVLDYLKDDVGDKVDQFLGIMKIIDKYIDSDYESINKELYKNQQSKEKSTKTPYKISDCCHNKLNLWLLKPTGFNRGIGIHIFQNFDQLRDIMCTHYGIGRGARDKTSIFQTHNQNHQSNIAQTDEEKKQRIQNFTFVIQKLVEKPRLYQGRKFDIRAWVLYNSWDGKVYLFKEPYVRTSSKEYKQFDINLAEEEQLYTQLTNNAVQKNGEEYGKFEEGNIVSIQRLFEHIVDNPECPQVEGKSHEELEGNFRLAMKKHIMDSMKSVKGKFLSQKYTFELLGYDFILDEQMNTILIEVNTNPCLEESNKLLKFLLPRMVDNLFCICMDPLFSPQGWGNNDNIRPIDMKYKSKFPLPANVFNSENPTGEVQHQGYPDDENLWEHVYTQEI